MINIYYVTEYNDRRLRRFDATQEEVDKLRCNRYDFVWDQELDEIAAITEKGERCAIYNAISTMGELRWYWLGTLLKRPGYLTKNVEIGRYQEKIMLRGLKNNEARLNRRKFVDDLYNRDNILGAVNRLRTEIFHDDDRHPYFIITKQLSQFAWHIDRSFLLINFKSKETPTSAKRRASESTQSPNPSVINSLKSIIRNFKTAILGKSSNKKL